METGISWKLLKMSNGHDMTGYIHTPISGSDGAPWSHGAIKRAEPGVYAGFMAQ